jgi:hypothetical protein
MTGGLRIFCRDVDDVVVMWTMEILICGTVAELRTTSTVPILLHRSPTNHVEDSYAD